MSQISSRAVPSPDPHRDVPESRALRLRDPSAHRDAARCQRYLLLLGVLLPLLTFVVLGVEVVRFGGPAWDAPVLGAIHRHLAPTLAPSMILLTELGLGYGVVPASAVLLVILGLRGHFRDALFFGLATLGAAGLNEVVKPVFHRARPHLWASPLPEFDYGFPSGHSMASMALVAALLVLARGRPVCWVIALVGGGFVLGVGISRLYLGVHYPSDILAAWSVSLCWVSALAWAFYGRGSGRAAVGANDSNSASPEAPPGGTRTG